METARQPLKGLSDGIDVLPCPGIDVLPKLDHSQPVLDSIAVDLKSR